MTNVIPKAFFAYPSSRPTLGESIRKAVRELNAGGEVKIQTWEECKTGGKFIIDIICNTIDEAELFFADLTGFNANVMFELGYAIARDKRIWLIIDMSYPKVKKMFDQLKVLSTVGYASCSNSKNIVSGFDKDKPFADTENTIFRTAIDPNLKPGGYRSILHLKSKHEDEAAMCVSDVLQDRLSNRTIVHGSHKTTVESLAWYVNCVYGCNGLVCHFADPEREGVYLQTARHALVCGMAHGFKKPLLMLAEGEFLSPIDYRDYLKHYDSAHEALRYLEEWLPPVEHTLKTDQEEATVRRSTTRATTDEKLTAAEGYFQSLESFESHHIKHVQDRHTYLKMFVPGTGREESIIAFRDFASQTDKRVLLIHAQGGIGKTRFALESLKRVKEQTENIDILFNKRQKYVNVNEIIPEISEKQESLIVLDDVHLIDNLTDFANILLERDCAKMILITRSTASESVKGAINYPAEEMKLTPLDRDSSIELLKDNLENQLTEESLRKTAAICEGNPLLIGISVHLINKDRVESLDDLKADDLVRNYLETILAELKQRDQIDFKIYEPYLALLYLLKPFSVSDTGIRSLIRSLVNIDEVQEGLVLRNLEQCAVLERHGDTLWLYPDLLGEYLVMTTFFSDIPILNFDDIFPRIPPSNLNEVFKTLRELDSGKSRDFLRRWTRDLSDKVESQNNFELCDSLGLLEIIAPIVTDEALQIIDVLLRPESEKPPSTSESLGLATTREYPDVLWQCLRLLESLRYSDFDETLEKVLRIYFYKPDGQEYSVLRDNALEAITKTAAYNLNLWEAGWGYSIQTRMFERVRAWKHENLERNFTLILRVCGTLLETEIKSQYSDYEGISWTSAPVVITDELIRLRREIISLLQSIFDEVQESQQRVEVLEILKYATSPSGMHYNAEMSEVIRDDANTIINSYLVLVNRPPLPEVEVLEEIEQQAHHLKVWHDDVIEVMNAVNQLLSVLQSHAPYQLFRTLAGDDSLFSGEDGKSYEQIQTEKDRKIKEIADGITDENLCEWLEKLNKIAIILSQNSDQNSSSFCHLLFEIGKDNPQTAQALIDNSLRENSALKEFVAEFIRGIRASTQPEIAGNYVREWMSNEDQMLILEIPETYRAVDEKILDAVDVEIFASLLNCRMGDKEQNRKLNIRIMSNFRWVYKQNPAKATEIICQLFKGIDQDSIYRCVHELWWARKQIDLSQWDLTKFEEILNTFENLPTLNNDAIYILAQYAQKEPLRLIQFFERRVAKQTERGSLSGYRAIPHGPNLKAFAKVYQAHPEYSKAIDQIMGWFQKDDYHYKQAAVDLISGISPELDGTLKETLLKLIRTGNEKNILAVLKVLEEFREGSAFDDVCKEAVKHSKGNRKLQDSIEFLIVSGPERVTFQFKEKLRTWLEDENRYVRDCAQRVIQLLEGRIEVERKWAAEEEIKRKKGLS